MSVYYNTECDTCDKKAALLHKLLDALCERFWWQKPSALFLLLLDEH